MDLPKPKKDKPETSYVHNLDVEVYYFNEHGIMKPSAYQALFAELAEKHLSIYKSGAEETMKYGLAWALISISIEVKQQIEKGAKLSAYTWYSQRQGPFFRRELVFADGDDNIMFQGSTFSVLLDISSRKVFRKKELPFKLTEPNGVFSMEANHRFREEAEFTAYETRKTYGSDLDLLGHVNNRRYGDFAYDALTESEQIALKDLKRMDFYFVSEMRKDDSFTIFKSAEKNKILLRGKNNTKEDVSFDIVLQL